MNIKEKMMDNMMGKMSPEERKEMMDKMMDSFFANMTKEEKQDMMNNMMPKMMEQMMDGGSKMDGMIPKMMEQMMSGGKTENDDFHPMDMCREMMSNISKSSDIATFATPEVRQLFEEWVLQVDDEIMVIVKNDKTISPEKIAEKLKISKESVLYFLTRLAQKGRITLNIREITA